jgi:hypothetical protein
MNSLQSELRSSFGSAVARWWRNWTGNRAGLSDLNQFYPDSIDRIASEVGVNASEMRTLAGKWPDSADLLSRRMASLHLDPQHLNRTEPAVTNDLKRLCSLCAAKRRCENDLDTKAVDPVWRQYCPNTTTLTALIAGSKEPTK